MGSSDSVVIVHPRHTASVIARIAAIPFFVVLVVLLLSDRAPDATEAGLRRGVRVGRRIEGRTGIDVIDRTDLPFNWEQAGHIGLWALAAMLAYVLFSHRTSIIQTASGVFAASAAFELGQLFLTATRHLDWDDLAMNGIGVLLGTAAASIVGRRRRRGASARSIAG